MKRLTRLLLPAFIVFGFTYFISSCQPDCATEADDPCDCPEEERPDSCFKDSNGNTGAKGNLQIIVKKKGSNNPLNNYSCLAVLGRTASDMYFFNYESRKLPEFAVAKPVLLEFDEHETSGRAIDTAYSRKGNTTDPSSGKTAGAIEFRDVPTGTYYLHLMDGKRDKYVTSVTITEGEEDDLLIGETQPLGRLKVLVAQSSASGEGLDSIRFGLFGLGSDTLQKAMKTSLDDVTIDPFFTGRTQTLTNENGLEQKGIAFLMDIPAREYLIVAYSDLFAPKEGEQASEYEKVEKNILSIRRLNFQ